MGQVIDDRSEDWFRLIMDAVKKGTGGESIAELISAEIEGRKPEEKDAAQR